MGDVVKTPSPPASSSPAGALAASPRSPAVGQTHNTAPLVVDENPEEGDDLGIEIGAGSDTTSLKSSILRYREENGRTYHAYKDGAYLLPNDDAENERLDLQHTLFLLTFDDRLHCVSFEKQPDRVLDAGCGTGVWAVDYADEHPESHVTGVDLSPIQPAFVPPNVRFFVDDIEDDWNFSTPFDFVFARFMTGSIKDWPRFFEQSFENLNPGGAIEVQDIICTLVSDDGTCTDDSSLRRWTNLLQQSFSDLGRSMDSALQYEQQLAEAGFVDISTVQEKWPTNWWPKDKKYKQIGIWNHENMINALGSVSYAIFTRPKAEGGLGWSRAEVEVLLAGVRKDMKDTSIHAYWRIHSVSARKL